MIYSMTAFGRSDGSEAWGKASWSIRSVNQRYLDMTFRLPEALRELEASARQILQNQLHRGKIECSLNFIPSDQLTPISVNQALLEQLVGVAKTALNVVPHEMARIQVTDLLAWEGVVTREPVGLQSVKETLLNLFQEAVVDLKESRRREGEVLARLISEKLINLFNLVKEVKVYLPEVLQLQRQKIIERLEEVKSNLDTGRLEQEMVYYAQKIDVDEELERTLVHLKEVERTLGQSEAAGRRLDFMMQELNREANTLASKSTDTRITHASVEMKVLIEQMREQVQNIE